MPFMIWRKEKQSFKNRATLWCPEGEHAVPHRHAGQLGPALSSAAGAVTHVPFARVLHLLPSPHLPGTGSSVARLALPLAPAQAPVCVKRGVLCPVCLESARKRLSRTTPNKSSPTFPQVFLMPV